MTGRKLLWIAVGYAAALLLAHYLLPAGWLLWASGASLAAGLGSLALRRRACGLRPALALCAAAVGFLWTFGFTALTIAPCEAFAGEERSVTVVVTDSAEQYDGYARVYVRSVDAEVPHVRMLVYDYDGDMAELRPGDLVEMPLKLLSAGEKSGRKTDDYYAAGVFLRGYLKGERTTLGRSRFAWVLAPKELSRAIREQVSRCFPTDVSGLMRALLTGDKAEYYTDEDLSSAMSAAGFSHVVAVSGMHLGFLMGFLRLVLRRRRLTAWIGMPAVLVFIAMIGFTPSVTRAGVLQLLLLLAPLLRREEDAPSSLSAALLILLLIDPIAIGSLSLQFSFAAMAGLILLSPAVHRRLTQTEDGRDRLGRGLRGRLLRELCAIVSSSLGAIAFTTPLSALHFGCVPVYGLLTNLLCLWLTSGAFLLGFAVCLAGLIWPALGAALGSIAAWLPRIVVWIVRGVARLPFAVLYTDHNLAAWWLVFVYAVFLVPWLLRGKKFRPVIPLCAAVLSFCLLTFTFRQDLSGRLEVSAVDVGQGQCIVAMTDTATVMIDCGSADHDVQAGDRAAAFLASCGRRRVDLLVLTHFHGDHVNGVRRLLSRVPVTMLAIPADYAENDYSDAILRACETYGTTVVTVPEDRTVSLGGLDVRLYAPIGVGDVNEACMLVCGDWGDYEFLVTGDVSSRVERMLVRFYPLEDMELLVAGHHGSRSSTGDELLDAITPETVVVSCGADNDYGHPSAEVLERLEKRNITVRRTDLEGTVTLTVG